MCDTIYSDQVYPSWSLQFFQTPPPTHLPPKFHVVLWLVGWFCFAFNLLSPVNAVDIYTGMGPNPGELATYQKPHP